MINKSNKIKGCEVCGNLDLVPALNLGQHPMCDDLILIGEDLTCYQYPIEIVFCKTCITAHQHFQVPKRDLFPSSYHYRSRFTADVLNGMKELVSSCKEKTGPIVSKKILDIGCNDGSLLDFFKQEDAITFGIEPTDAYMDAKEKGHFVYNSFLSDRLAHEIVAQHGKMDFITFTNVFAHIENLQQVIASLKILMGPETIIVIENHYLGAVLDGNQFDTFYHEHPRTYSFTSFEYIAASLGVPLFALEFPARYGGNIRVFFGNNTCTNADHIEDEIDLNEVRTRESHFIEHISLLNNKINVWKKTKGQFLHEQFKKYGKLRAKGFPGRAAILIKLLGLNEELIEAVYEKPGSLKIGHYVPGTRIPIRSDEELLTLSSDPRPLLNLAWHISKEIRTYMTENGYSGAIIDILTPEDFFQ